MITSATIAFVNAAPVTMDPADVPYFIGGEVPPQIADRYLNHGMPRRGLVTFTLTVSEHSGTRIIGPNLARRAGTASSAVER
jgi:hypothetical protein